MLLLSDSHRRRTCTVVNFDRMKQCCRDMDFCRYRNNFLSCGCVFVAATKKPTHKCRKARIGILPPYVAIPRLQLQKGFPRHELYKLEKNDGATIQKDQNGWVHNAKWGSCCNLPLYKSPHQSKLIYSSYEKMLRSRYTFKYEPFIFRWGPTG